MSIPAPARPATPHAVAPAISQRSPQFSYRRLQPGIEVCEPTGRIQAEGAARLRAILRSAEQRLVAHVIVDLSEVESIADAGIRALVAATVCARAAGRKLSLVVATQAFEQEIRACDTEHVLTTYARLSDAVAYARTETSSVRRSPRYQEFDRVIDNEVVATPEVAHARVHSG